jgi:AcrR family transcriptional regulator
MICNCILTHSCFLLICFVIKYIQTACTLDITHTNSIYIEGYLRPSNQIKGDFMPRSKKVEQSEATIQKLVAVAREEFSQKGYSKASTETIVQQAGVTRGALYHHFSGKRELFLAVFREAQLEIGLEIQVAVGNAPDLWGQLVASCRAFLRASADPARQQIVVVDAPAVLAWRDYRQVDALLPTSGRNLLRQELCELGGAGLIKPLPLEALTHLLNGAIDKAAMWVAHSDQPAQALDEAQQTLETLLQSLKND